LRTVAYTNCDRNGNSGYKPYAYRDGNGHTYTDSDTNSHCDCNIATSSHSDANAYREAHCDTAASADATAKAIARKVDSRSAFAKATADGGPCAPPSGAQDSQGGCEPLPRRKK